MNQNTIYIDCFSGISGDKFLSALYNLDLIKEKQLCDAVDNLNIQNFSSKDIFFEETQKKGFRGLFLRINQDKLSVKFKTINEVNKQIDLINFKNDIKNDIRLIYNILFEAEGYIHGKSLKELHLHEVASIDTLIDVSLSAFIINELNLKDNGNYNIICSKINLGSGIIDISHGTLSVPPPAVSYILKEVPVYGFGDDTELTTPTGAALIKYYAGGFSEKIPSMEIISEGYGCGSKDLDRLANILRIFYGKSNKHSSFRCRNDIDNGNEPQISDTMNYGEIVEMQCNIDDMNPEIYDFVIEKLFKNGAVDVFLTPVIMKKNRPGIVLNVLCDVPSIKKLSAVIMEETTTIGVRIAIKDKIYLDRFTEEVNTPYGTIKVKVSKSGNKILNKKPEYENLKKIALNNNVSLKEVYSVVNRIIK
jgi:uncharacterized protein (TIGR00299 family) protein